MDHGISLLKRLPKECWPEFVRGDWVSDRVMTELEQIGCAYLFKIKKTVNVKKAIHHAHCSGDWLRYNNHWEEKESTLIMMLFQLLNITETGLIVKITLLKLKTSGVGVDIQLKI